MKKNKTNLQLKLERRAVVDAKVRAALLADNKKKSRAKHHEPRRSVAEDLLPFLAVSAFDARRIREFEAFSSRAYCPRRRTHDLIRHLFLRYPVPDFLYRTLFSELGKEVLLGMSRAQAARRESRRAVDWEQTLFFAAAQGRSVAKLLAGTLTKKEAHWFMLAPSGLTAATAVHWARMRVAGMPSEFGLALAERLSQRQLWTALGDRAPHLYKALAEGGTISRRERDDLLDFLCAAITNRAFDFRGRCVNSLMKLSREWHRRNFWGSLGRLAVWVRTYEVQDIKLDDCVARFVEMTSNRDLYDEGGKQMHCVYTYQWDCQTGITRIVSVRFLDLQTGVEFTRLTMEVDVQSQQIVQIRGRHNRRVEPNELRVIRHWASKNRLRVQPGS